MVATEKFGRNPPYVMKYNPTDGRLVIGGKLTLKFYQMDGDALRVTPAVYSHGARKGYAQCSVLSLAFLPDGSTFGGTAKGDVYKYEEGGSRAVRKFGHLHHGPIHDMCFTGKCLVSAGKDGKVKLWSVFMKPEFQLSVTRWRRRSSTNTGRRGRTSRASPPPSRLWQPLPTVAPSPWVSPRPRFSSLPSTSWATRGRKGGGVVQDGETLRAGPLRRHRSAHGPRRR